MFNISSRIRSLALVWLAFSTSSTLVTAQNFGLSVTASPSPLIVSNSLTYIISLTNTSGISLTNVIVTDTLPSSAIFQSATNNSGSVSNSGSIVTFMFNSLTNNQAVTVTLVAQPTAIGNITNSTIASATNAVNVTNLLATTVYSAVANLAVGLSGFASGVLSNDVTSFTLSATNLGPSAAPNVVISNPLPVGIKFISIAPTNSTVTIVSNNIVISLGTLANGVSTNFSVTIQPTNAGTFAFTAQVSSAGLLDTNSANDAVTNTLTVSGFATNNLVATFVSAQTYNPQTGLMQQTIRLTNIGTNAVASARIFVIGLTNQLFNAVGTNNGNPYVVYANSLATNSSVDLLLEYFVPTRLPVPNPTLLAVEVSTVNVSAPASLPPNITLLVQLAPGSILVEFDSVAGKSYTVLYSDNASFTNAFAAQPVIAATANRTQWIDNGPPKTISTPGASRFYRVLLNQ